MNQAIGHNSKKPRAGGIAVDQLKSIIARIEKLTEEKEGVAADIRDVLREAAGNGFDCPAIKKIIKLRKLDAQEREEAETTLDVYLHALGMITQPDLFDEDDDREIERTLASANQNADHDDQYAQAVSIVVRDQKASTSYLQRMLKTGYTAALRVFPITPG